MGYGGATWDTAGTLDLGSGNTFDVADSTEDGPVVYDQGWWKFTAPSLARITLLAADFGFLKVYTGATEGDQVEVTYFDHHTDPAVATFDAAEGVEYHVLLGIGSGDTPQVSYQITWTQTDLTASGWIDVLQDTEDNYLIVTHGDARLLNPNAEFNGPENSRPEWMEDVIRGGQARQGHYDVSEVFGGEDPIAADGCAMAHADYGHEGNQLWNGGGDETDTSGGVCRTLPPAGPADEHGAEDETAVSLTYSPTSPPSIAANMEAQASGPSWAMWHLPVRDNMPPWGALDLAALPDPEDYGYPAGSTLEWEPGPVDLLGIEIADGDPVESFDFYNLWSLNASAAPVWNATMFTGPWGYGDTQTPADLPFVAWSYGAGDIAWNEIPDSADWDGHDWVEDYALDVEVGTPSAADGVAIAWPTTGIEIGEAFSRYARVALKYNLRARRFRFVYEGTGSTPPRRGWPSNRGFTAPHRGFGGRSGLQDGPRGWSATV